MVNTRAQSNKMKREPSKKSSEKKRKSENEKVTKSKRKVTTGRKSKKATKRGIPNVRRSNMGEEPLDIWQAETVLIKDFEDIG